MNRFWKILWVCFIQSTWKRPLLLLASIAGIAAGTGILCALNMANDRALHSFEASARALGSESASSEDMRTMQWRSPRGKVPFEELDACLKFLSHGIQCRGVISGAVRLRDAENPEKLHELQVIGMDGSWEALGAPAFSEGLLTQTSRLEVPEAAAPHFDSPLLEAASSFSSRDHAVILSAKDAFALIQKTGRTPGYDWLEVSQPLPATGFEQTLTGIETEFKAPLTRTTPEKVIESQKALTFTYRFNLKVLSMMSVLIGALLVANVATLYFLLKRPTVAVLRQLGASRREILSWVLFEQTLLGLIGGIFGLLLGIQLEKFISGQVLKTISDLYLKTAATQPQLSLQTAVLTVLSGMLIFLGAGFTTTLSMTRVAPAALGKRVPPLKPMTLWPAVLGFICLIVIVSSPYLPPFSIPLLLDSSQPQPLAGYLGAGAVFVFSYALSQYLLAGVSAAVIRLTPPGIAVHATALAVAARRTLRSGARGRAPVATLAGGLSLAIGVTLMVGGFRESLGDWLGVAFNANIMGAPQSVIGSEARPRITEEQFKRLRSVPFIEGVDCLLTEELQLGGRPFKLAAIEDALLDHHPIPLVPLDLPAGMSPKQAIEKIMADPSQVIVSETFSNKFKKVPGDQFQLELKSGSPRTFTVLGSAREYSSELGYVILSRPLYMQETGLDGCHSLRVYTPIESAEEFNQKLGALHPDLVRDVRFITSHELRSNALRTFNDTFAITDALAMLAAVLGGLSLLTQLVQSTAERAPEWLTLRRIGNTWWDLFRFCSMDILLSVLAGVILGVVSGTLLGWVLCYAINFQAFGWTVRYGTFESVRKCFFIATTFGVTLWIFGSIASVFVLRPGDKWKLKRE